MKPFSEGDWMPRENKVWFYLKEQGWDMFFKAATTHRECNVDQVYCSDSRVIGSYNYLLVAWGIQQLSSRPTDEMSTDFWDFYRTRNWSIEFPVVFVGDFARQTKSYPLTTRRALWGWFLQNDCSPWWKRLEKISMKVRWYTKWKNGAPAPACNVYSHQSRLQVWVGCLFAASGFQSSESIIFRVSATKLQSNPS